MKCYTKAHADATAATTLDPSHVKSIGRRGTAAYHLHDYRQARRDFSTAIAKEPGNAQFQQYLQKTLEKMKKIRTEAYEKMTRSVMFTDLVQIGFEEQAV